MLDGMINLVVWRCKEPRSRGWQGYEVVALVPSGFSSDVIVFPRVIRYLCLAHSMHPQLQMKSQQLSQSLPKEGLLVLQALASFVA
jgi:hypothetical protein